MKLLAIDAIAVGAKNFSPLQYRKMGLPSLGCREGRVAIFDRLCGAFVNKSIPPRNISYQGISKFTE